MIGTFWSLAVLATALVTSPPTSTARNASDVEQSVERMLTAIGGRTAWAGLRNTVNDSQQNRLEEPTVVRAVITMDFTRPRFRIETTAPNLHVIRVIDGS